MSVHRLSTSECTLHCYTLARSLRKGVLSQGEIEYQRLIHARSVRINRPHVLPNL